MIGFARQSQRQFQQSLKFLNMFIVNLNKFKEKKI